MRLPNFFTGEPQAFRTYISPHRIHIIKKENKEYVQNYRFHLLLRTVYPTIPPSVEYSLTERGKTLIPALESIYNWADGQMKAKL